MRLILIYCFYTKIVGDSISYGTDYDFKEGSLDIILKDTYLNSLRPGRYTLEVEFKDGITRAEFIIKEIIEPVTPKYNLPKTGIE